MKCFLFLFIVVLGAVSCSSPKSRKTDQNPSTGAMEPKSQDSQASTEDRLDAGLSPVRGYSVTFDFSQDVPSTGGFNLTNDQLDRDFETWNPVVPPGKRAYTNKEMETIMDEVIKEHGWVKNKNGVGWSPGGDKAWRPKGTIEWVQGPGELKHYGTWQGGAWADKKPTNKARDGGTLLGMPYHPRLYIRDREKGNPNFFYYAEKFGNIQEGTKATIQIQVATEIELDINGEPVWKKSKKPLSEVAKKGYEIAFVADQKGRIFAHPHKRRGRTTSLGAPQVQEGEENQVDFSGDPPFDGNWGHPGFGILAPWSWGRLTFDKKGKFSGFNDNSGHNAHNREFAHLTDANANLRTLSIFESMYKSLYNKRLEKKLTPLGPRKLLVDDFDFNMPLRKKKGGPKAKENRGHSSI